MNQLTSPLSALVLSSDLEAISTTVRILASHGFDVKRASNAATAEQLCRRSRFDLAVYDLGCSGWTELLELNSAPRVVIGLTTPGGLKQALAKGIHFLLQKPFTVDLFTKTMKAAYGTIATDRLRSFRHQVDIAAIKCKVTHDAEMNSLEKVRIANLSQTGVCLEAGIMLSQGAAIEVSFALPDSGALIELRGTIVWTHTNGRAGIKITEVISGNAALYDSWLTSMLPSPVEPLWKPGAAVWGRKPISLPIIAPAGANRLATILN